MERQMIERWKGNPLFRLLAFLDVVGLQRFSHAEDLSSGGTFIDPEQTVAAGSAAQDILLCGVRVLRANITRLFEDEKERSLLLGLVGDPNEAPTNFIKAAVTPSSLPEFEEVFDSALPLWARQRLQEAVTLNVGGSDKGTGPVAMGEQFLIDAIDTWMKGRSREQNDSLVLACGVKPEVLGAARNRASELPDAVEDFIIDVIFPPSCGNKANEGEVLDWLIASYEQCYEVVDLDGKRGSTLEEEKGDENGDDGVSDGEGSEVLLTGDNIATFMRENPSVVPKAIVRELRRKLHDPEITEFELQNHYLASELVAFARSELGLKKGLNRSNCIRAILEHHSATKAEPAPKNGGPRKRGRTKQ